MRKTFALLIAFPLITNAQLGILGGKNIIKTNISGDIIQNYNLTYERSLVKKLSLSIGVRYMPKSTVPYKEKLEELINNKDVRVSDFQMGNFAITPELRLYLSAGKMKGFYIAPYARYASFDLSVPVTYTNSNLPTTKASALFVGKINSISGGLLIGTQFQLAKKLVMDIWIIGGHYGNSSGTIYAVDINPAVNNAQDRKALQDQLNDLKEIGPFRFEGTVTSATTAEVKSVGPWAGIRGLGLNLGIRF